MKKFYVLFALVIFQLFGNGVLCASNNSKSIKKTVILQKNKSVAEQVNASNTIYIIRHDVDLKSDSLNIPNNCVLKFEGGTITNGIISLNKTRLEGVKGFRNVKLVGNCTNSVLSSDLFILDKTGKIDNSIDVQSMFAIGVDSVSFSKGIYSFSDICVKNDVCIFANGSTFVSTVASEDYAVINNIFTVCNTSFFKLFNAIIQGHKSGSPYINRKVLSPIDCSNVSNVELISCTFKELTSACYKAYQNGLYDYRGVSLSCHGCENVLIDRCEFYDMGPSEWIWIAPSESGTWDDVKSVYLQNNYFHNPKDDYERSNTPVNVFSNTVIFENNLLEYQKYAGSAFNLQCKNVIVRNNVVRNSYFKSIVDVCEYGDFCNDFVSVCNNDFSAYNSQAVVSNAKELIVSNNRFKGISAVLAYATYYNPEVKHAACVDYATKKANPNQNVLIEGNECNCDYVDMNWLSDGELVQGGYCSGFNIQSIYCISDSVNILNNKLYIRDINSKDLDKRNHQPIFVRNAKNINISGNYIESDVPAMGSKYKGAIYVLVYNRDKERDAKLTEIESLKIVDNEYNISSDDKTLYTIRISHYSDNTADWKIKNAHISGNSILNSLLKEQIYTTGGSIERLTINEERMDVKNSPAEIKKIISNGGRQ